MQNYEVELNKLSDLLGEMKDKLEKLCDDINKKPREFWIETYENHPEIIKYVHNPKPKSWKGELIHVREVKE